MMTYSAQAHWVSLDTILWNYDHVIAYPDHREFRLYFDPTCSMRIESQANGHTNGHNHTNGNNSNGFYTSQQRGKGNNQKYTLVGGEFIKLTLSPEGPSSELMKKFPHLSRYGAIKLPEDFKHEAVSMMLKCQLMITIWDSDHLVRFTGLQIPGVLDSLYGDYDGSLGVCFGDDSVEEPHSIAPTLKVWAPTARKVAVRLYDDPPAYKKEDDKVEIDENDKKKLDKGIPVLPYRRSSLANVYYAIQKDDDNDNEPFERYVMVEDLKTGVWSVQGEVSWLGKYYLYEIEVYVPRAGRLSHHLTTDPYSVSLSADGHRSQIIDIRRDPESMPNNWISSLTQVDLPVWAKNNYNKPVDAVIYELHIRDFSSSDDSVPDQLKGTYLAFADEWLPSDLEGSAVERDLAKAGNTNGMKHLKALAESGLTHIHLLPAADFASVDERGASEIRMGGKRKSKFTNLFNSSSLKDVVKPCSKKPQGTIRLMNQQGLNPYNWGYDPVHWLAPEGSYATNPDGPTRISQFRRMVAGLHRAGLRVVMDVVFNHMADMSERRQTCKHSKRGLNPVAEEHFGSILERIVPGYYHRLDLNGKIERSACGLNTASEHAMMRKLMVDALKTWAVQYRVDGFRFDLMGHHMKYDIEKVKETLTGLNPERDGVDGSKILIYGEGWDFGEVACNSRGVNATQMNLVGTGIGTFNDRLRDAVRGGSAFGPVRAQGFATGLLTEPNQVPNDEDEDDEGGCSNNNSEEENEKKMKYYCEIISLGMAGNLGSFPLMINDSGKQVKGKEVEYHGQPAGYCSQPSENVIYASAHDNETLFDAIQIKSHPTSATIEDRVRMHCLANAIIMLSHGIAFFQAGDDILRSKSLDRNSYNAGDWFNTIDFSYNNCGWGKGLPLLEDNGERWDFLKPLLANPALAPHRENILKSHEIFKEFLRIRRDCSLFRLPTEDEINKRVQFYNLGKTYTKPGLIVMSIDGTDWKNSNDFARVVVLLNADKQSTSYTLTDFKGLNMELHPVQQSSVDEVVRKSTFDEAKGEFSVPGRTAAVFVQKRVDVYFV